MSALGSKVPYTQAGLWQIASCFKAVADLGYRLGHFQLTPSGTTIDLTVPAIADVAPADITARQATISGTVYLAGAIETATVNAAVLNS